MKSKKKNENLTVISVPIKDFSTFLIKFTKYNRVPLGIRSLNEKYRLCVFCIDDVNYNYDHTN